MSHPEEKQTGAGRFRRELIEWGLIILIPVVLYITGLHTEVLGRLQQVVLWTGLFQPDTEVPVSERQPASYDLELTAMEGDATSLHEFRGKVIFLNYWATWCPPCIAEMPNIQALYSEYGERDEIVFVMVSLDDDREKARAFIRRKGFTFPVYYLESPRPRSLQSNIVPATFVINREGKIVVTREGMADYNTERFKKFLDRMIADF